MVDLNHILRSGKYKGRTVGSVYKADKRYISWVLENRPEMLKSHKAKAKPVPVRTNTRPKYVEPPEESEDVYRIKPMSPNEAFDLE